MSLPVYLFLTSCYNKLPESAAHKNTTGPLLVLQDSSPTVRQTAVRRAVLFLEVPGENPFPASRSHHIPQLGAWPPSSKPGTQLLSGPASTLMSPSWILSSSSTFQEVLNGNPVGEKNPAKQRAFQAEAKVLWWRPLRAH